MLVTKPTVLVRRFASARAVAFGRYPSPCAAASTRSHVSADTRAELRRPPLSADEAAASDTPAARATSRSVGASLRRRVFGGVAGGFGFEVGTDVPGRWNAGAGRAAAHCSRYFVRGGARRRSLRVSVLASSGRHRCTGCGVVPLGVCFEGCNGARPIFDRRSGEGRGLRVTHFGRTDRWPCSAAMGRYCEFAQQTSGRCRGADRLARVLRQHYLVERPSEPAPIAGPNGGLVAASVSTPAHDHRPQSLRSGFPRTEAPLSPVAIRRAEDERQ